MNNKIKVFIKACSVIYSCKHIGQSRTAVNYVSVALKNGFITECQHNLLKIEYNNQTRKIVGYEPDLHAPEV